MSDPDHLPPTMPDGQSQSLFVYEVSPLATESTTPLPGGWRPNLPGDIPSTDEWPEMPTLSEAHVGGHVRSYEQVLNMHGQLIRGSDNPRRTVIDLPDGRAVWIEKTLRSRGIKGPFFSSIEVHDSTPYQSVIGRIELEPHDPFNSDPLYLARLGGRELQCSGSERGGRLDLGIANNLLGGAIEREGGLHPSSGLMGSRLAPVIEAMRSGYTEDDVAGFLKPVPQATPEAPATPPRVTSGIGSLGLGRVFGRKHQ